MSAGRIVGTASEVQEGGWMDEIGADRAVWESG